MFADFSDCSPPLIHMPCISSDFAFYQDDFSQKESYEQLYEELN